MRSPSERHERRPSLDACAGSGARVVSSFVGFRVVVLEVEVGGVESDDGDVVGVAARVVEGAYGELEGGSGG